MIISSVIELGTETSLFFFLTPFLVEKNKTDKELVGLPDFFRL